VPRSETFREDGPPDEVADARSFVKQVVERWRGAAGAKLVGREEPPAEASSEPRPVTAPPASTHFDANPPVTNRLDLIRAQLLRR
jgi:hypothetical protein